MTNFEAENKNKMWSNNVTCYSLVVDTITLNGIIKPFEKCFFVCSET